jgi:hypothetical protein
METTEKTELGILSEISRISNSSAGLPETLLRLVEAVARNEQGWRFGVSDRPVPERPSRSPRNRPETESIGKLRFPLGMGIAGWVAEQKVPLALDDPYADPRFTYVPESGIEQFKSLAAAPIMYEDQCLGVLFVLSSAVWSAASSDITLLTTTANQISGVIKNAQMFQDIQDRLASLATIYEIGLALTSTLDLEPLLSLIAKNSAQSLRAQGCTIRLMNLPEIANHKTASTASSVLMVFDAKMRHLYGGCRREKPS